MKINKAGQSDDDLDDAEHEPLPPYYLPISRLEVFRVRIDTSDDDDNDTPADIYGTISLHDPYSMTDPNIHFEIFTRKKGDYDSFLPGMDTELLLTGPPPSSFIDVLYEMSIYLALFNDDYDVENLPGSDFPYTAIDITNSFMPWGPSFGWMSYTITHDKILSRTLFGEFGSVTVDYIIFGNSIAALLEITLLSTNKDNGNDGVDVCGRVIARNSKYVEYESLLFRRHKGVHVKHGELIPLSRSKIAAPFESSLIIEVDFWGHEKGVSIAKGEVEFHLCEFTGTYEKIICGEQGEVLVKITWWADEVKAYRKDPSKFAVAVAPLAVVASSEPASAASKEAETKDEPAEYSDDDLGFSLFD